jgi:hypothetical protein
MSENLQNDFGCRDDFAKLCALSTTNSLTADEWRQLEAHLAGCSQCAALVADYRSLASEGMAKLAALLPLTASGREQEFGWNHEREMARLLSSLGLSQPSPVVTSTPVGFMESVRKEISRFFVLPNTMPVLRFAAVVVLISMVAYQIGMKRGIQRTAPAVQTFHETQELSQKQLAEAQQQQTALNEKLAADSKLIEGSLALASHAEQDLAQQRLLKASLEGKIQELGGQNQQQSSSLEALTRERLSLQQKVQESESLVQSVRQQLGAAQDERQQALLETASLEAKVNGLSAQLQEKQAGTQRQEQYLSADRDVRELMGARELYIADVFDIDSHGQTKRPFGRIFYTRGKSLIFYAFDLDQQPGFRNARTFQAWGRQASSQAKPVSLGIFYVDNEANRRWALKYDDPKILDEINSVFVTVEPKGGSKKPTNTPFLVAYLKTAQPNHP